MQKTFTDQLGHEITLNFPPKRIVSLVPSQTELLFDLGLDKEIVGVTKFCIHPGEQVKDRSKIGGTKNLRLDLIHNLQPDLIIGNKEENQEDQIKELMAHYPVWMSDIHTLDEAREAITGIGDLVDRAPEAAYLNHLINVGFTDLQTLALRQNLQQSALYFIWREPYMLAGPNTFIHDVLRQVGLVNVIQTPRYPALDEDALRNYRPDWVFLSSEPYPFKEQHIEELQRIFPYSRVLIVDGEMFSWYGSRLVKAVQYFYQFQKELVAAY